MKRRGFLGFMGGAVAAGPGMARQAAAQTLGSLSTGDFVSIGAPMYGGAVSDPGYAIHRLGQFKKFLESAEALRRRRLGTSVNILDPDLAQMRSFSLSAKIRMQRERNFQEWLDHESSWLQRAISGQDNDY